jgi:hypothetical protein
MFADAEPPLNKSTWNPNWNLNILAQNLYENGEELLNREGGDVEKLGRETGSHAFPRECNVQI